MPQSGMLRAAVRRSQHVREFEAIGELAARAANPADPLHALLTAGIAQTSGLHPASLERLVVLWGQHWQRHELQKALRRGLHGHARTFRPVGRVAIVAPGNLCVATWQAIAEALLVGNRVTVRPGSGDPHAADNFARALRHIDPFLADRLEIQRFERGDRTAWLRWLGQSDALLVFGGDEATGAVLQLAGQAQFVGRVRLHGHLQSIGVLSTQLLADPDALRRAAAGWAVDALLADGRGCMSLRALWLVGAIDDAGRSLVRSTFATEFASVANELPAGRVDPRWQAQSQLAIESHAFAATVSGERWLERGAGWAILGTQGPTAAALGPGARALAVWEATDARDLQRQLTPWQHKLSTASVALGADRAHVRDLLERLGVHRTCAPGAMQAPPADRAPDGHVPFSALVRLSDRA